jgi:NAD-dependent DNA ligase
VSETIGLCRGLIADGNVDFGEARMLLDWLERNPEAAHGWPFDVILPRLREMLADGVLDPMEEAEFLDTLMRLTGDGFASIGNAFVSGSTTLPLDTPQPSITWLGKGFAFTGQMACGTRKQCQEIVSSLGGLVLSGVSRKVNYLVIGSIGSEAWLYSTHGRKIENAVEMKQVGFPIAIVSEQHWLGQVRLQR